MSDISEITQNSEVDLSVSSEENINAESKQLTNDNLNVESQIEIVTPQIQNENNDNVNVNVEIVPTNKRKTKLFFNGYYFIKEKGYGDKTYWKCENSKQDCSSRLTTKILNGQITVVNSNLDHNHLGEPIKREVFKVLSNLKDRAKNGEKSSEIIKGVKRGLDADILVNLPSKDALQQRIKRVRRHEHRIENVSGSNFEINETMRTIDGESFLIGDDTKDEERVIVFGTIKGLELLVSSEIVLSDGTFRSAPQHFMQLYCVHATVSCEGQGHTVPALYCLLTRKNATAYKMMLDIIIEACRVRLNKIFSPKMWMIDFKAAVVLAIREKLVHTRLHFCWFHSLGKIILK